jgi:small subunit ribosomal protein S1
VGKRRERYPVGSRVKGTVVNIMNYGAFVRLEEGIEGLIHISEMSWTKRIGHPGDILNLGDESK